MKRNISIEIPNFDISRSFCIRKDLQTFSDIENEIFSELYLKPDQYEILNPPNEKRIQQPYGFPTLQLNIIEPSETAFFILPDGTQIKIINYYKMSLNDIIKYLNDERIYISDSCMSNNLYFQLSDEITGIQFPLLPAFEKIYLKFTENTVTINCGPFQFYLSDHEQSSFAYDLLQKTFIYSQKLLILDSQNRKLNRNEKLNRFERYTIQAIYQFHFKCRISNFGSTTQCLNYFSSVYDAQKQLATVYSEEGEVKLRPENIEIFSKELKNISGSSHPLASFQDPIRDFHFNIKTDENSPSNSPHSEKEYRILSLREQRILMDSEQKETQKRSSIENSNQTMKNSYSPKNSQKAIENSSFIKNSPQTMKNSYSPKNSPQTMKNSYSAKNSPKAIENSSFIKNSPQTMKNSYSAKNSPQTMKNSYSTKNSQQAMTNSSLNENSQNKSQNHSLYSQIRKSIEKYSQGENSPKTVDDNSSKFEKKPSSNYCKISLTTSPSGNQRIDFHGSSKSKEKHTNNFEEKKSSSQKNYSQIQEQKESLKEDDIEEIEKEIDNENEISQKSKAKQKRDLIRSLKKAATMRSPMNQSDDDDDPKIQEKNDEKNQQNKKKVSISNFKPKIHQIKDEESINNKNESELTKKNKYYYQSNVEEFTKNKNESDSKKKNKFYNQTNVEESTKNKNESKLTKKNKYYYQTNIDDDIHEIELDSNATVETLKQKISIENDVDNLANIKVIFAGKDLLNNICLNSMKIGDTILFVYIRSEQDILLMTAKALKVTQEYDDYDDYDE